VIEKALRDSAVFSAIQTELSKFDVYCAYGSAIPPLILNVRTVPETSLFEVEFWRVWV
jgi:hypothetical protein